MPEEQKKTGVPKPVPEPKALEKTKKLLFLALADMKAADRLDKWHSLLTMEDLMVAALMKRLMYEGQAITNVAAYHGLRDAIGCLIAELKEQKKTDLAKQVDSVFDRNDGSDGDPRAQPPMPNP